MGVTMAQVHQSFEGQQLYKPGTLMHTIKKLSEGECVESPAGTMKFLSRIGIVELMGEDSHTNTLNEIASIVKKYAIDLTNSITKYKLSPDRMWRLSLDEESRFHYNVLVDAVDTSYKCLADKHCTMEEIVNKFVETLTAYNNLKGTFFFTDNISRSRIKHALQDMTHKYTTHAIESRAINSVSTHEACFGTAQGKTQHVKLSRAGLLFASLDEQRYNTLDELASALDSAIRTERHAPWYNHIEDLRIRNDKLATVNAVIDRWNKEYSSPSSYHICEVFSLWNDGRMITANNHAGLLITTYKTKHDIDTSLREMGAALRVLEMYDDIVPPEHRLGIAGVSAPVYRLDFSKDENIAYTERNVLDNEKREMLMAAYKTPEHEDTLAVLALNFFGGNFLKAGDFAYSILHDNALPIMKNGEPMYLPKPI